MSADLDPVCAVVDARTSGMLVLNRGVKSSAQNQMAARFERDVLAAGTMVPYMATPEQNARFPWDNERIRRQAAAGGWLSVADPRAAVAKPGRPHLLGDTVDGSIPRRPDTGRSPIGPVSEDILR